MILSVGQMIHRKGFDVLLRAAKDFPPECGVYIVGGKPSPEMERLVREGNLQHVHFVDFMSKEALSEYYHAADLFVFPTREDIWGLVVNEAMAHGLPVITTTRSMAGMELVYEGENGFIIPSEDEAALAERVATFCQNEEYQAEMPPRCLETAMHFTIEKMAKLHMEILA